MYILPFFFILFLLNECAKEASSFSNNLEKERFRKRVQRSVTLQDMCLALVNQVENELLPSYLPLNPLNRHSISQKYTIQTPWLELWKIFLLSLSSMRKEIDTLPSFRVQNLTWLIDHYDLIDPSYQLKTLKKKFKETFRTLRPCSFIEDCPLYIEKLHSFIYEFPITCPSFSLLQECIQISLNYHVKFKWTAYPNWIPLLQGYRNLLYKAYLFKELQQLSLDAYNQQGYLNSKPINLRTLASLLREVQQTLNTLPSLLNLKQTEDTTSFLQECSRIVYELFKENMIEGFDEKDSFTWLVYRKYNLFSSSCIDLCVVSRGCDTLSSPCGHTNFSVDIMGLYK
ncbi:hypothetical protein HMI54_015606 [Coelomomyces lativittatus]|nr:hypothetical protein HMI54_015606 [Coelomomyces lativittatus]KAJ1513214.1 hypothetical protein HMI56_002852 [Coelomomyces lativittatus]KAJ1513901.1 hypothetical protein HMI55_005128 [Coelomomyces lativittatus]